MANLLTGVWNWATGRRPMPDLPPNMIYERDVSSDNDFWISCVFDPTMDIMYVNGLVTDILDTDKCLINGRYHYQPKTEKEIRNFPYIEVNSAVRISLYRKKNSNTEWKVASCFLTNNGPCHRAVRHESNNFAQVHFDEPTVQAIKTANNKLNKNVDSESMSVEVIGDMPKIVCFEKKSIIQILFRNNSYAKEEELLDYRVPQENHSQLSIVDKVELPVKIRIQSHYIFDIQLTGKYIGRSTEKVEFIFKDITYKVGINIHVTDSRIIVSNNSERYTKPEIDMKKLFELQNDFIIPGVRNTNKIQFPAVKIRTWEVPSQLMKCFWTENGKYNW